MKQSTLTMSEGLLSDPAWHQALTLAERLDLRRSASGAAVSRELGPEAARRRLERWRVQPPFTDATVFARRLAADGMSEEEFAGILEEPAESWRNRLPDAPEWLKRLAAAFSCPPPRQADPLPAAPGASATAAFLECIQPVVAPGCDRLRQGVEDLLRAYPQAPGDAASLQRVLLANLPRRLVGMVGPTMVLELNVARLEGRLQGDTPAERFRSFVEQIRQPERALALLREYPVLARQLQICVDQSVAFALEFLTHLCADWPDIVATFFAGADPGAVVEVRAGGDRHRDGRCVSIVRFSSGLNLVYKPRSMAIDRHFQHLLDWMNERSDGPAFRALRVLDHGAYGWMEFAAPAACASAAEVTRFYERQGGYLALLCVLRATDFHHENLIAAGEHPVLIDLESLFQPRLDNADAGAPDALAASTITDSVLRVGLLPWRVWSPEDGESMELGGLGGAAGQMSTFESPDWEDPGLDEMRFTRRRKPFAVSQNLPSLRGEDVSVLEYGEALIAGFTKTYRLLERHRDELLAESGPLAWFRDDEVRVILRATRDYGTLLIDGFHPDVLRDALDRDLLLDRLWLGVEAFPALERAIRFERSEMERGDVPLFTTHPGCRDLWSSLGERIPEFYRVAGLADVQRRLREFCDRDLELQIWMIRASLADLTPEAHRVRRPARAEVAPREPADRAQLLEAARAVGDRLESLALRNEKDVSWIGLTLIDGLHHTVLPLMSDLYDGTPGVVLFLAYLGGITGEGRYTALAQRACATLRRSLLEDPMTWIGGFEGWGGIIYALTHLSALWGDPELLVEAENTVERLPALIEEDEILDIIGGAAGCIGGLLSLYSLAPSPRTLAAAVQCGDRLIARAQPMEQGLGWALAGMARRPLSGFAHGAAGIAWALLKLAGVTGEDRFHQTALGGITYERSLFSREAGNWRDLRDHLQSGQTGEGGQDVFSTAWCHGAPGIGLARLSTLHRLDDAEVRAEIDTALRTTAASGLDNHSLCHGQLGNLELLLQASQVLDGPRWRPDVDRFAGMILESIRQNGWRCGNPVAVESPGLMSGLAGIGYGLLRLAEPERTPSILLMAPPRWRQENLLIR